MTGYVVRVVALLAVYLLVLTSVAPGDVLVGTLLAGAIVGVSHRRRRPPAAGWLRWTRALIATLLVDLLRHERPEVRVARFRFRAMRPLFDGEPFFVCGEPLADGRSFRLWARHRGGALAMDATATVD